MRIAEAANACGLSAHAIRFYEKSGMVPKIERGADGHRHRKATDLASFLPRSFDGDAPSPLDGTFATKGLA